jgi:hypothetical protein
MFPFPGVSQPVSLPDLSALTAADVGLADRIAEYNAAASANRSVSVQRLGGSVNPSICDHRLSCVSGNAFPGDTTATTIYLTQKDYNGGTVAGTDGRIAIYDGARHNLYGMGEVGLSLSGLVPGSYDVFVYDLAGLPTLETLAWNPNSTGAITGATNATPVVVTSAAHGLTADMCVYISGVGGNAAANGVFRVGTVAANTFQLLTYAGASVAGSGAYTGGGTWWRIDQTTTRATALDAQDGVLYKHGALTRRYVGSIYIYQTGQVDDTGSPAAGTPARRHVYSHVNPIDRPARTIESADSWTYSTATFRCMNNSFNNRIEFFQGWPRAVAATLVVYSGNSGGTSHYPAIGLDSVTAFSGLTGFGTTSGGRMASYQSVPSAVGFHYLAPLEASVASGTTTWFGDGGAPTLSQSGLQARITA